MKQLIFTTMLLVSVQGAFAQTLLDSLQGKWTVTKISSNNKNTSKAGTLFFSDDGKFVSTGNHFGGTNAVYTTNETTSTVFIDTGNKKVTEWTTLVKNGILYLTSVDNQKGKASVVKIQAVRQKE